MNEELLYTPEELAKRLKLSKYTVYEMIKRGDIKAHHIGRRIRVSQSQLDLYLLSTGKSENVYSCHIVTEVESHYALVNGIRVSVPAAESSGMTRICIPPEDVILSSVKFVSSARNMLLGTVTDIIMEEGSCRVLLDVGFPLMALITKKSLEEMDIKNGTELYAVFKTMSVKIF